MCLYIQKDQEPNIATQDIVCYKFLETMDGINFQTPYQKTTAVIGLKYSSVLVIDKCWADHDAIEHGLHSFVDLGGVKHVMRYFYKPNYRTYVIVECVIPKGSTYYSGKFHKCLSYASDCIIYVKILN